MGKVVDWWKICRRFQSWICLRRSESILCASVTLFACGWLIHFFATFSPLPFTVIVITFWNFFSPFLISIACFRPPFPTLSSTHSFLATLLHKFALSLVLCTHIAAVLFPSTFLFSFCFCSDWIGARRDGYFFIFPSLSFLFCFFFTFTWRGKHQKSTLFILKNVLETKEGNGRCCRFC